MSISPEKWDTVKALFDAALELDSSARSAFLCGNCADTSLRAEVERLLNEHDKAGGFLSTPVLGNFPLDAEAPTQTLRLSDGDVLAGRFLIVRFIAGGGMGDVYEAEDQELRERVAIKTIRPEILVQPNSLTRFKREVRLSRQVTHPNVCRVFDLFRHKPNGGSAKEETIFISMELLCGKTLGTRLKEGGRMSMGEALPLVRQIASALTAAHAAGIVHRDLKPGNVVLVGVLGESEVRAVVTDFGLALQSLAPDEAASLSTGQGLLGTPAYMSPEQLEGRPATAASDIYALGLVIYEMVTGGQPFQGDTPISAALKRLSEAPIPPRQLQPELTPQWESVIERCLERNPEQRFANPAEVASTLDDDSTVIDRTTKKKGHRSAASSGTMALAKAPAAGRGKLWKIGISVLLIGLLVGGGLYYRLHPQGKPLTDKDTIVLADLANSTGDAIFDDTLKTALSVALRQSPFLNLLSDDRVGATLKLMTRPANTPLTSEVIREVCQRTQSKAYIAGSIATLGSEYVLELKAVNCQSGDTLAQEQVTAASKEKVLDALGEAASKLRGELGESLATVQKFDIPLAEATTSSLEALKAYTLGTKANNEKGSDSALFYNQRAIELDPNFALACLQVGWDYFSQGEAGRASEYFTKAFQLREHASEREKLSITASYYANVTGELEKAAQISQEWIESYPRDPDAYNSLGLVFSVQGRYANAAEITRQAVRLARDRVYLYNDLANYSLALQRFDETRQIVHEAQVQKLDAYLLHDALYALAFLGSDSAAMAEQQQWYAGKPDFENNGLGLASDTEAYAGHLRKARELTRRSADSAIRADHKENGAIWLENSALREAAFGNMTYARQAAADGLRLVPASQDIEVEAALAFAVAGDAARAESLAQDLGKRFPLDTQMHSLWLPAIQAQLSLGRKNPTAALNTLRAASTIELGQILFVQNISCLYHVYVRGEAYLAAGQGSAAAAEFQKIIDHSGIVWNCWTGSLAHLGVARANALQARTSQGADADAARVRALAAYKDFLTLWNDADPDIPILKEAKAEYAKLQ